MYLYSKVLIQLFLCDKTFVVFSACALTSKKLVKMNKWTALSLQVSIKKRKIQYKLLEGATHFNRTTIHFETLSFFVL